MKISSSTTKEPILPVTPGVTPPRFKMKMKNETTSTRIVVVWVEEMDVLYID